MLDHSVWNLNQTFLQSKLAQNQLHESFRFMDTFLLHWCILQHDWILPHSVFEKIQSDNYYPEKEKIRFWWRAQNSRFEENGLGSKNRFCFTNHCSIVFHDFYLNLFSDLLSLNLPNQPILSCSIIILIQKFPKI